MCLSPHEMTVAQLEEIVAYYSQGLDAVEAKLQEEKDKFAPDSITLRELERDIRWYARKVENFEAVLKERAEEGRMAEADDAEAEPEGVMA